jgi:hypothetical protein
MEGLSASSACTESVLVVLCGAVEPRSRLQVAHMMRLFLANQPYCIVEGHRGDSHGFRVFSARHAIILATTLKMGCARWIKPESG